MKKKEIIRIAKIIVLVFVVYQCREIVFFNKRNHLHTEDLGNGIYEERFKPFNGGVLMTDTETYYITDSTTFRKFIDECDEKELYRCIVRGDTLKTVKYSRRIHYGKDTPIDSTYYSIKDLKKEGNFD